MATSAADASTIFSASQRQADQTCAQGTLGASSTANGRRSSTPLVNDSRARRALAPDRVKDSKRGHMLGHVVNAKERSPAGQSREARGYWPNERAVNAALDQRTQEPFSRDADKDWTAKIQEITKPGNDLDVLQRGLPECNSGIKHDARPRDARLVRQHQRASKKPANVGHNIDRGVLLPTIMHDHDGRFARGDSLSHGGILLQTPNIVDHHVPH